MQPDHRQSNYWVPPQEEAANEPPVQAVTEPVLPVETVQPAQQIAVEPQPQEVATIETVQLENESVEDEQTQESYDESDIVRWKGLEHIPHERNALWFVGFAVTVVLLLALSILIIRSWTFTLVIIAATASLLVYVKRPPRELTYALSQKGLYIGDKFYDLAEYKSFGVIRNGIHYSVLLIPLKRFMPGLTVYFPHETGEQLVDSLAARLPMQELHIDLLDKLIRKLRL